MIRRLLLLMRDQWPAKVSRTMAWKQIRVNIKKEHEKYVEYQLQ